MQKVSTTRAARRRRLAAVALALVVGTSVASVPSLTATAAVNAKSKASVAAGYRNVLVPALATDIGWTGSATSCDPGAISANAQDATVDAINYMRELSGLSPISFDTSYNKKAQKAALVYSATNELDHYFSPLGGGRQWKCLSEHEKDAKKAGLASNIALGSGIAGPQAVIGYMDDPGRYNNVVGHRRWILNPSAKTMGSGSTNDSQVLWVQGAKAKKFKNPAWVEWPAAGYFPQQLEPDGRWSLTANAAWKWNFSKAKVSVTSKSGKRLKVKVESRNDQGYANDTIVFKVSGVKKATGSSEQVYTVKVTGMKKAGSSKKVSYSYKVRLFDAS